MLVPIFEELIDKFLSRVFDVVSSLKPIHFFGLLEVLTVDVRLHSLRSCMDLPFDIESWLFESLQC